MAQSPFSDHYAQVSPLEFEKQVRQFFELAGAKLNYAALTHGKKVSLENQTYDLDLYLELDLVGVDVKILVECKRHKRAISRDEVFILIGKVAELGYHKGILFSVSGFQSGAIKLAKKHGVALIRIIDGEALVEVRGKGQDVKLGSKVRSDLNISEFVFEHIEQDDEDSSVIIRRLIDTADIIDFVSHMQN